jgi:hypothetical protein
MVAAVNRTSLILLILAACGRDKAADKPAAAPATPPPAPAPAPAPSQPPAPAPAPKQDAPVAALPGDEDRAFVTDSTGLVEVATSGRSQVVVPGPISWCNVDARAHVVWFVTAGGLRAYDLIDRRVHPIIKADLGQLEVIVDWGAQKLGGESLLEFQVGVAIRMTGVPKLEMEMGCDGDSSFYCFEEDGKTPNKQVAGMQKAAKALKLADLGYVGSLAARGKTGTLWTPPPMPPAVPKQKPPFDKKQCADRSTCGALTAIPGSALWLVQTGNSRGDYYHETRELWDPSTGDLVRRDGARMVRTKKPPAASSEDTDYGGLRVSPGGAFTRGGAVFDATKVYYTPKEEPGDSARSCGWARGGWRIPGPTD